MPQAEDPVVIDGATLDCAAVTAVARRGARVMIAPDGLARAAAAHQAAVAAVGRDAFYGRTTGVGANGKVAVEPGHGHGLRLLRSHAGGAGDLACTALARGALAIRLNQLAAGGSGADPAWLEATATALNSGLTPQFRVLGAIGTGDLTGLAATALALIGERPWRAADGQLTRALLPRAVADADALAFLSSNAVTLAQATLAHQDLAALLDAELAIAALSSLALSGSAQPYAEPVQAARPHPGQQATARRLRELLGPDASRPAARVQDPYGLRALPQVHGPAADALGQLERVLTVEVNAAAENPLVDAAGGQVLHNGNFHGAYLGLALDCARLALCADAALSPARLAALTEPERTGLRPFLAGDAEGSSGILILEYTASAALAELRGLAAPVSLGAAVLSRGAEEHASFSPQAARAATAMVPRLRTLLACELVAAVRALRQRGLKPSGTRLRAVYDRCAGDLPAGEEDRPLDADIAAAERLVDEAGRG
ncbi:MAG TPA: aromatic amino acid ammonia-lyase [Trebonia sp.]|nr:aromatic amino acid ammonia-lyase [Trebonia sp.]